MDVDLQFAGSHFADLVSAVDKGEEVRIARADKPGLRLVVDTLLPASGRKLNRKALLGVWEGLVPVPTDAEWSAMDKEIEDEMLNGPIFPTKSK